MKREENDIENGLYKRIIRSVIFAKLGPAPYLKTSIIEYIEYLVFY